MSISLGFGDMPKHVILLPLRRRSRSDVYPRIHRANSFRFAIELLSRLQSPIQNDIMALSEFISEGKTYETADELCKRRAGSLPCDGGIAKVCQRMRPGAQALGAREAARFPDQR